MNWFGSGLVPLSSVVDQRVSKGTRDRHGEDDGGHGPGRDLSTRLTHRGSELGDALEAREREEGSGIAGDDQRQRKRRSAPDRGEAVDDAGRAEIERSRHHDRQLATGGKADE